MFRTSLAIMLLVSLVVGAQPAQAAPPINVYYAQHFAGTRYIVVLTLPEGIDRAARQGNADFTLEIAVTYRSNLQPVTDTHVMRLADTQFRGTLDAHTAVVQVFFEFEHIYDVEEPIQAVVTAVGHGN